MKYLGTFKQIKYNNILVPNECYLILDTTVGVSNKRFIGVGIYAKRGMFGKIGWKYGLTLQTNGDTLSLIEDNPSTLSDYDSTILDADEVFLLTNQEYACIMIGQI